MSEYHRPAFWGNASNLARFRLVQGPDAFFETPTN